MLARGEGVAEREHEMGGASVTDHKLLTGVTSEMEKDYLVIACCVFEEDDSCGDVSTGDVDFYRRSTPRRTNISGLETSSTMLTRFYKHHRFIDNPSTALKVKPKTRLQTTTVRI